MVDADRTFVIVGGGLAGAKAAETLRAEGFNGRVILIGDERDHPYERPPLSKGFLAGKEERDSVFVHEPAWYAQHDIELHLGQPVTAIDRAREDGPARRRHRSSSTTGCCWPPAPSRAAWTSPAPTWRASTICAASPTPSACRHVLKALGRDNGHLVIAGAGWIGLEVAAAARGYGAEVTVVEPEPTPLHNVVGPELGAALRRPARRARRPLPLRRPPHRDRRPGRHGARRPHRRRRGAPRARRARRDRRRPAHRARRDGRARHGRPGARRRHRRGRLAAHLRPRHLRGRRRGRRPPPAARRPAARRALGQRAQRRPRRRPRHARTRTSPTTASRTSSPTSTTSASNTRAGRRPAPTTRWWSAATRASASSSRSGSRSAGSWRA